MTPKVLQGTAEFLSGGIEKPVFADPNSPSLADPERLTASDSSRLSLSS